MQDATAAAAAVPNQSQWYWQHMCGRIILAMVEVSPQRKSSGWVLLAAVELRIRRSSHEADLHTWLGSSHTLAGGWW